MQSKQLLINYLVKYDPKINKASNPWKIINKNMPKFVEDLSIAKLMPNNRI